MIPYTLFFITTVYALTVAVVLLDFFESRLLKDALDNAIKCKKQVLCVHLFKVLAEVAIIWLIIAFFGQIWMGWISF